MSPITSPGTSVWRPTPRACAWCLCCGQLWAGHRPPAGSPVEAAACRTGGMGQGQCLVLVQVTGCHRSMPALVSQCVNTKKHSMQTCSEMITEHPTPWGAKSIVCWIACGNSSFCWQQQMGVQAPSAPLNRTPPKNGCTTVHPVQWLHLPWRIFFQMETQLEGPK